MKRILIDYTYYQHGKYHGGGEYGDTVIRRLLSVKNVEFGLFFYDNATLRNDLLNECIESGWAIYSISSFRDVPELISTYNFDTFFSALPYQHDRPGVKLPDKTKYIATYHGLRELELSDYSGIIRGQHFGLQDKETI